MISAEVIIHPQFYDLDPMNVVWHGNYPRFLEQARCALLDRIGYNYEQMLQSGYAWPIVDMQIKYVRPIRFAQVIVVRATLTEYENRACIDYRILDQASGEVVTKARTVQLAIAAETGELQFVSPAAFVDKVKVLL
ncbi:MAG: acyl-CoA thioesterase [Alphaproteobacteria bacterium]|nr:acyl-CoA thioesterase [Alphaproteobacteria bacterium]